MKNKKIIDETNNSPPKKLATHTSFGERIRKIRFEEGLTQQQVVDEMGKLLPGYSITRTSLANWESGEAKSIDGKNLVLLAKVLGISPSYIIFGREI